MKPTSLVQYALSWFVEFGIRFVTKTPKFFVVFIILGFILACMPEGFDLAYKMKWIDFKFKPITDGVLYGAGVMAGLIAKIVNGYSLIAKTEQGNILAKIDEKKMPFTAKIAEKKVEELSLPTVTGTVVAQTTDAPPETKVIHVDSSPPVIETDADPGDTGNSGGDSSDASS